MYIFDICKAYKLYNTCLKLKQKGFYLSYGAGGRTVLCIWL